MNPIILYRGIEFEKEELHIAKQYFKCTNRRPDIKKDDLVICRYSAVPFFQELNKDIEYVGARAINNYNEHLYIADLQNYVYDIQDLTPRTWSEIYHIPDNGTAFVLKGETNSRKSDWKNSMFAANKQEAIAVYNRLSNDGLIGQQKIYIREYVPLVKYMDGVNGMPVTKEFRFFVAYGKILCGDYYWQNYIDDLPSKPDVNEVPKELLQTVIDRVHDSCNAYVIDVGQTQKGDWIVIELNDLMMSGLSCNDPNIFYQKLRYAVDWRMKNE